MINWSGTGKRKNSHSARKESLSQLTHSFSEMLEISEIDKLYKYIGTCIQSNYYNSVVFVSTVNGAERKVRPLEVSGINGLAKSKAESLFGFNTSAEFYKILPHHFQLYKKGTLERYNGNLEDFSPLELPTPKTSDISESLNINNIYVIGIKKEKELLAVIHICTQSLDVSIDKDYIELFVGQAGVIIHKIMVEKALKESEAHFSSLADMGQAFIWTSGIDAKFNYINKILLEFVGYPKKEPLENFFRYSAHPDDYNQANSAYLTSFESKTPYTIDLRIRRYDGQYRWVQGNASPMFNEDGVFLGFIGHGLDITERKKTENELQKFKLGIEQANEAIFITDPDGSFTYANPSFERVYGFSHKEIDGKTPRILKSGIYTEDDYKILWSTLQSKKTISGCITNKSKSGKLVEAEGSISPILSEKGEILGYLAVQIDVTERKKTEQELTKLSKAIEQSPVSIMITDTEGHLEYANPYFSTLTGYSIEEVLGQNPRFLQSGETSIDVYKQLWDTVKEGNIWRGEIKNKKKNGEIYYESAVIAPVFDEHKNIINFVGVKKDITERKISEQALRESEKTLREAQQLSRTGHYIVDLATNTWKSSPVIDDILGLPPTFEKTVVNFGKLIAPEFFNQMQAYYYQLPTHSFPFFQECKIRKYNDGKEIWISIKGEIQRDNQDNIKGYIGTIQDITERKKFERELMLSNEKLESLLRISTFKFTKTKELFDFTLSEAIKLTESKIGYLFLYSEETKLFTRCSWSDDIVEISRLNNICTLEELSTTGIWGEVVCLRKPVVINKYSEKYHLERDFVGPTFGIKKFLSIPVKADRKVVAILGVANKTEDYNQTDITQLTLMMNTVWKIVERQKMIEDLVAAKEKAVESDNLKSAFLANMSHEIRTPMNAILGFSELLSRTAVSPTSVEKYANIIHSRSIYLLALIDDILDLSKVEAGIINLHYTTFQLNTLLDEIAAQTKLKLQKLKKDINISIERERTDNPAIYCDRNRVQQLLINLVDNAIKFTQNGSIIIKYYSDPEKGLVFSVTDTGMGIPSNNLHLIFERFHKSNDAELNYSGLGLGLSICKGIVKILGGEIWVDSEPKKGSSFSFNIPVQINTLPQPKTSTIPELKNTAKGVILLVEDDESNVELFKFVLEGFELIIAADGVSAIECYKKNPRVDIILMDIGLPDMSGFEVTKNIRKTNLTVPIIALTAFVSEIDKQRCFDAGCNDFLSKPVETSLLLKTIISHLKP